MSVCDVVTCQLYFLFGCGWLHGDVCRLSCLYDKWRPDIGLKGRPVQMDWCYGAHLESHSLTDKQALLGIILTAHTERPSV